MNRRSTLTSFFVSVAAAICFALPSQGAETVINEGAARNCFVDASAGTASSNDIATCTTALDSSDLTVEDRAATYINRGILKEKLSDLQGALSDFDQGVTIRPDLADAYLNRGAVLIKLARYSEANADLDKAVALASLNLHVLYYNRGQAREHVGDFSGACADYKLALSLQPNYAPAREKLAVCRYPGKAKTD